MQNIPVVETSIASPHNMYLGIAFGYGSIGIIFLLAILLPAIRWAIIDKVYLFPAVLFFMQGTVCLIIRFIERMVSFCFSSVGLYVWEASAGSATAPTSSTARPTCGAQAK